MSVCSPDSPIVEQGILLRELNHRIDSGLASAINLVSAAAIRVEGAEAKRALSDVVELLHGHADVQQALAMPKGKALIDAATYIRMMGSAMRRSLLDRMNIGLALATESLPLQPDRCRRLGLIVHGLVTDAAKHACFEARTGEIRIKLSRIGRLVNCVILDNGSRSARGAEGRGPRISNDLAKGLGGRVEHGFGDEFTSVVVSFPLTEREWQANWTMVKRRITQSPRRSKDPSDAPTFCTGASSPDRDSRPVATPPDPSSARGAQLVSARPAADVLGELLSPGHRMEVS
ncbi:sensor histidine kinase [Bradyrhizobium sp. JYMT SZCCT0428]|uniref:sensor histidine kinase n=1 Tax=Bradyrhizobium sp. JYMT SZCCT0428 TaxID=2807673 RepID=UPI001BA70C5F|nr:sensor histidine kinase [Bradyrhizobium sp. JYMT SZCCT0428]MBR1156931.1 sensor histidine kinase [Bradyrhizobium sp. JYMT SZCCT0428]